jgi:hypothetical protein
VVPPRLPAGLPAVKSMPGIGGKLRGLSNASAGSQVGKEGLTEAVVTIDAAIEA